MVTWPTSLHSLHTVGWLSFSTRMGQNSSVLRSHRWVRWAGRQREPLRAPAWLHAVPCPRAEGQPLCPRGFWWATSLTKDLVRGTYETTPESDFEITKDKLLKETFLQFWESIVTAFSFLTLTHGWWCWIWLTAALLECTALYRGLKEWTPLSLTLHSS